MLDFITSILDAEINYIGLLSGVFIYIAVMWLAFTIWVFVDARKKFNSILKALLLTLFVFPLNIPGFILYLIFRPEHDDFSDISVVDGEGHQHHLGGVQVPLVHFTGDGGEVQMTFGLTLNTKAINANSSDMNIDVSWDSQNEKMILKDRNAEASKSRQTIDMTKSSSVESKNSNSNRLEEITSKLQGSFNSLTASIGSSFSKSSAKLTEETEHTEESPSIDKTEESDDISKDSVKNSSDDKDLITADKTSPSKGEESTSSDSNNYSKSKKSKKKKKRR